MRKLLFIIAIAFISSLSMNAQGFRAGVNLGLPIGDIGDFSSFNVGVDLQYLWEVNDGVEVGVTTGYSHFFGKEIDILGTTVKVDDVQFIPIAATGSINLSDEFSLGADIGYALGVNTGNDGGFYYRPKVAYGISEAIDIVASYSGVSVTGGTINAITLGVNFGF